MMTSVGHGLPSRILYPSLSGAHLDEIAVPAPQTIEPQNSSEDEPHLNRLRDDLNGSHQLSRRRAFESPQIDVSPAAIEPRD